MSYKADGIKVIDADGHVLDTSPQIPWEQYLPEPFKQLGPKHLPFEVGGVPIWLDGQVFARTFPKGKNVIKGQTTTAMHRSRPGMWDSKARMPDMDAAGIDTAVLFGGTICINSCSIHDPEFRAAMCHAYNAWLGDYCKPYGSRLKGVASVPLHDVERAVTELHHVVKDLGFVAVTAPSNHNGKTLFDPSLDPVYAACERLGVPMCCHLAAMPGRVQVASDRFNDMLGFNLALHPIEQMIVFAEAILYGTLDRHPKLKLGFMEGWCGWVPFWLDRMQDYYEKLGEVVDAKAKPRDYWASGQLYIGAEGDETTLPTTISLIGDTQLLYASDYWHFDAGYFDTVKEIWERPDLSETSKRRLLHDNAARLYNLL